MDLGPTMKGGQKNEDLYMFTIEHLSLRKGERIVMPIAEYTLDYKDVYALNIPFSPPSEIMRNINHSQRNALTQAFHSPKVKHKIRMSNKSKQPLTTAPAMILKKGRIVAQGMMTYTPVGGDVDIVLTTAVDIAVKKSDKETKRTPNAVLWNSDKYTRIDLDGMITLTNYKTKPVTVEITRYTLGNVDNVAQNGKTEMVNPHLKIPHFSPMAMSSLSGGETTLGRGGGIGLTVLAKSRGPRRWPPINPWNTPTVGTTSGDK